MDGVRFSGVYSLIPEFSHPQLIPDDPTSAVTTHLNAWVAKQNRALAKKSDSFSRHDKQLGRKINPIQALAVDMVSPLDMNRRIIWITNDSKGQDLDEFNRRTTPLGAYAKQGNSYSFGDAADANRVHRDFLDRAINQGIFFAKASWFSGDSRLQASITENETTLAKPNIKASEVVFRQPTGWERFWMRWRQP